MLSVRQGGWVLIIRIHAVYLCTLFLIQSIHYPSQARCSSLFTHTFAPKGRRWMQNSFKCSFSKLKILLQMAKAGSPRMLPILRVMAKASIQYWRRRRQAGSEIASNGKTGPQKLLQMVQARFQNCLQYCLQWKKLGFQNGKDCFKCPKQFPMLSRKDTCYITRNFGT